MRLLIMTCICFLFAECQNAQKDNNITPIKVNISEDNTCNDSSYFSSLQTIFLETTENSLIGMLSKISLFNDRVYIFDAKGNKISAFDLNGYYLTNIGNYGRGPGESVGITDFFIDTNKREIVVYSDRPYKFMFFHLNGDLKYEIPCEEYYYAIANYDTNKIACINAASTDPENYISIISHDNKRITKVQKLPLQHYRPSSTFALGVPILKSEQILFTKRYDNTLYLLRNGKTEPYYKIDFGKNNFQEDLLKQNLSETEFDQEVRTKELIYSIVNTKETANKIFFNTHKLGTLILDKASNALDYRKYIKDQNLDISHSRMIPTEDSENCYICFEKRADELKTIIPHSKCIDQAFRTNVDKMSESDNPVLFIYKCK